VTRVLVVDDEPQILRALRINLTARRFDVAVAADGSSALRQAQDRTPDLVILDLGLPDIDGVEVIHGLRGWTTVPIIVLSGRSGSQDKVNALDAGADDYVTKPFAIEELLARIRAVTRRVVSTEPAGPVRVGDHLIDLTNKTAKPVGDGQPVHLTPTEWHILEILLPNPGKLVTQRELLNRVWGPTYLNQGHYARQYIAQLRRKLEPDPSRPRHLLTELGIGYRFQP
jgi:two-component system KDP operon response regulator KdpE